MWRIENRRQFAGIVEDLMKDPGVQALGEVRQHSKRFSRLDHSLYVAYVSFLMCRRLGLDYESAARAGLLHDFHFAGRKAGVKRLWRHPHDALKNASGLCPLNEVEEDIIVKHMWPLTRPLPRHRESFVVGVADKLCATTEFCRLYRVLRVKKNLTRTAA